MRSDIQNYLKEGKSFNLQRMQLQYMYSPINDVFARFDLGYLEEMFGGIGGEFLYRPFEENYSLGFSLHKVKQRGLSSDSVSRSMRQLLDINFYYDFPFGITSGVAVGKYLAGDKGLTLDLSRRFTLVLH